MKKESKRQWFKRYSIYLKSDKWKEKRKLVLVRCGGWCEKCRLKEATQVHHTKKAYAIMRELGFGSEPITNDYLIGICFACHSEIHKRPIGEFRKTTRGNGLMGLIDFRFWNLCKKPKKKG